MRLKQFVPPRPSMPLPEQELEAQFCSPENPADINGVAWASSAPQYRRARLEFTYHGYAKRNDLCRRAGPGRVASGYHHAEFPGGSSHAPKHFVEPLARALRGQRYTKEKQSRARAHACNVTRRPR